MRPTHRLIHYLLAVLAAFLFSPPSDLPAHTEAIRERFFLMGDGVIHIRNMKTGQEAKVALLKPDGSLDEAALTKVDEVFGFPTSAKGEHISPRLIFMLDYFSDLVAPGRVINMESGYRSPEYNERLRNAGGNVARTSTHMDGLALDFNIDGVDGKKLWEVIRSHECCGVGHYGGKNVHLDAARPRFWEAATSGVTSGESDFNRRIYLSTEYDRYRAGESVRLSFSAVSDFGFGIGRTVAIARDLDDAAPAAGGEIAQQGNADCIMIGDRKASRFIVLPLPKDLPPGRYRVKVDFCERPFSQMPVMTVSNEFEVSASR